MLSHLNTLESTTSSLAKCEVSFKAIEEIKLPLKAKDIHKLKKVLALIQTEQITDFPLATTEKILEICKNCIDHYTRLPHPTGYKKNIKLFYSLFQKLSNFKQVLFGCFVCEKVFKTKVFLQSHIQRRHSNYFIASLHDSLSASLPMLPLMKSYSTMDLSEEISNLRESQQLLKFKLEEKLKELSIDSPRMNYSINVNMQKSKSYKSIEEAEFQNFLKEISSKPCSPPEETSRNPQDLLLAAHALEIDPVNDTHYLYVAKQFLAKPLPKNWRIEGSLFKNIFTGELVSDHPGITHYKTIVKVMKQKKEVLMGKVKGVLEQCQMMFTEKYKKGMKACFLCEEKEFAKKKLEMNLKIEDQMQKLGKITNVMIAKIDNESTKRQQANSELEHCANIIESEAIQLLKYYKKLP